MKPEVFSNVMPAFFILNENNDVVLTNYRVIKGTYIVDRIFDKAQLVVGKEQVTIKRQDGWIKSRNYLILWGISLV